MKLPSFKEIFTMMFKIMALYIKFAIASSHLGSSGHVSVLAHNPNPLTPYNILYLK